MKKKKKNKINKINNNDDSKEKEKLILNQSDLTIDDSLD